MALLSVLAVLLFVCIISLVEIPKMLREKLIRELYAFVVLSLIGITLSILISLHVKIFTPTILFEKIYSPLSGFMKSLIK